MVSSYCIPSYTALAILRPHPRLLGASEACSIDYYMNERTWQEEWDRRQRQIRRYRREQLRQRDIDDREGRFFYQRGFITDIRHVYVTREGTVAWVGDPEDDVPGGLDHPDRQDAEYLNVFLEYSRPRRTARRRVDRVGDQRRRWEVHDYRRFTAILDSVRRQYQDPTLRIPQDRGAFENHDAYTRFLSEQARAGINNGADHQGERVEQEGQEVQEEELVREEDEGGREDDEPPAQRRRTEGS